MMNAVQIVARPKRRWGRLVFWAVLAAIMATGGYFFWRAHDHAAAVREAKALGWAWQQTSALELLKQDWKNAFKGTTWQHHPSDLSIAGFEDLAPHRTLLHRLRPERLYIERCRNVDALQGLDSVKDLRIFFSPDLRSPSLRKGFAGLGKLKKLILNECFELENTDGLEHLQQLERLELLDCSGLQGVSALRGLAALRKLKSLRILNCPRLESLDGLGHLEQLEELCLSSDIVGGLAGAMKGTAGLPKLKEITIGDMGGWDRDLMEQKIRASGIKCNITWDYVTIP